MLNREDILHFLRENRALLEKKFHVKQIGLFGSYALGEQTESSDIDFLVVIDTDVVSYRMVKQSLREYLIASFHKPVDLANPKSLKSHYKEQILQSAVYA